MYLLPWSNMAIKSNLSECDSLYVVDDISI